MERIEHELADKKLEAEKQRAQYDSERTAYVKQSEELEQLRQMMEEHKAKEEELENTIKVRYQKLMKERLQEEKRQWEQKYKPERSSPIRKNIKAIDSETSSHDSSPSESPFNKVTAVSGKDCIDDLYPLFIAIFSQVVLRQVLDPALIPIAILALLPSAALQFLATSCIPMSDISRISLAFIKRSYKVPPSQEVCI